MSTTKVIILLYLSLDFTQTWAYESRIINGSISEDGYFPFAAAFFYNTQESFHFCTGSLIADQWILTAAHCLEDAIGFVVYLGTNHLVNLSPNALIINATYYIAHENYNSSTLEHDIGLIFLPIKVELTDNIKIINLPTESLGANENTIALGWGATYEDQMNLTTILHHVELTTVSNAVCRRTYGEGIKDTMVCVGGPDTQGICEGDSGGPLIQIKETIIQVGIASFFSGWGCESGLPSGYTRTFEYVDWIKDVMQKHNNSAACTLFFMFPLLLISCIIHFFI